MKHANVTRVLSQVERIVAEHKEVFVRVEFAAVDPHGLRSEPVREIGHGVQQILVAVTVAHCRFPGDQNVLQAVTNVNAHLAIVGLAE